MVEINPKSDEPIFQQIVSGIEKLILTGELKEGDFLMSVREFAVNHTVNPNTVAKAYQEIQRKGLAESVRGKGLKVVKVNQKDATKRTHEILGEKIDELIKIAESLNVSKEDLVSLLNKTRRKRND